MELISLLHWFMEVAQGDEDSLAQLFRRNLLAKAAHRVADVLKELESGQLSAGGAGTVSDLIGLLAAMDRPLEVELRLVETGGFKKMVPPEVLNSLGALLRRSAVTGRVQIVTDCPLHVAADAELLAVVGEAAKGAEVIVLTISEADLAARSDIFSLRVAVGQEAVRVLAERMQGTPDSVRWTTWFLSRPDDEPTVGPQSALPDGVRQDFLTWVGDCVDLANAEAPVQDLRRSVADLFGDNIALRDLEPRTKRLSGLGEIRDRLCLARNYVPRKNEPDYALVLQSFVQGLADREDPNVIYVGDTLFNDGSAMYNLSNRDGLTVWGFLGREGGFGAHADFFIGNIYFGRHWASLVPFLRAAMAKGLTLGHDTVALFDLDQTVYAAKGRDDEALYKSRSKAILAFLGDTVPSYKFNPQIADQVYRTLDQDEYHHLTRDNMDYVVLLVLAVAAGLFDVTELHHLSQSRTMSISALTEELYRRAARRKPHEAVERVLDVVRAVYYNTLAGDQTPCKDFRAYECTFTAQAMRGGASDLEDSSRIVLNREVCDFVDVLRGAGCPVMAVSDRPFEAAVRDEPPCEDIMCIKMGCRGSDIRSHLLGLVQ